MNTIKKFQEFLLEKDKSSKTIEAYVRDIQQFYKYLRINNIKEIHNDTLKSYKNYLLHERFLNPYFSK